MTRASILTYIEARAKKLRNKAELGGPGWALAKHDARVIETIAADIRAEMDVEDTACPKPGV